MRNQILGSRRPTAIFGTLENVVVGALCVLDACILFDKFLIPPPDILAGDTVFAGRFVAIVSAIECHREVNLFEVAEALGLNGGGLSSAQGGQQHRGENCDDGDDDEEFD